MGKAALNRTELVGGAAEASREITWTDVHAQAPAAVITATDRLHLFAGDGEEGDEAPASIRHNPEALLEWCRRYQPERVLDEATALVAATNRTRAELIGTLREHDPKRQWTPADALDFLT